MDTNMYSFNPIQEWVFPGLLTDRGGSGGGGGGGPKMLYNQSQNIWG